MVLNGTTVQSPLVRRNLGDSTTTGRLLTISGILNLVPKSHISNIPGFGWKYSAIIGRSPGQCRTYLRSFQAKNVEALAIMDGVGGEVYGQIRRFRIIIRHPPKSLMRMLSPNGNPPPLR